MTLLLGGKGRFAVEVGEWGGGLRRVDAWAAGQHLTCDDNMAYVPQFRLSVHKDWARLDSIRSSPPPFPRLSPDAVHRCLLASDDRLREQWWFLLWGPTTDNVTAHLFPVGDHLAITLEFWREEHLQLHPEHAGAVFVAEIEAGELAEIFQDTIAALDERPDPAPCEPDVADQPR